MTAAVLRADARHLPLPGGCVDLVVTSPPYFGLRSYTDEGYCRECQIMRENGRDPQQAWPDYATHWQEVHAPRPYAGQIGSEATPAEWLEALWACTAEWVRVLKPEGSIFVNLGDKYSERAGPGHDAGTIGRIASRPDRPRRKGLAETGIQPKSLMGLPWRYAIGCMDRLGLILRAEIIWAKPNGLPESVTDRVRRSHEQVFHMVKQPRYYAAVDEIRQPHQPQSIARTGRRYLAGDSFSVGTPNTLDPAQFCNPLGALPGSVWDIPSAPLVVPPELGVDHFAAFPPALVRPVVLGWSPPGVCVACGQGRRPAVDRPGLLGGDNNPDSRNGSRAKSGMDGGQKMWELRMTRPDRITGYACACPQPSAPTRPSVVLDPFGGTGTTALVASVYGRHGITVDLSAGYCRLAQWRVHDPGERARAMQVPKPPPVHHQQAAMF